MTFRPSRNIGQTNLRSKRRTGDPMRAYDALPGPLRLWLSEAALPWSPASARKIWTRAQANGLSADETLALLCQAETRTLARATQAIHPSIPTTK